MGFHLMLLHQLAHLSYNKLPLVGGFFSLIIKHFTQIYTGCEISPKAKIFHNVKFPHPNGIVIGEGVNIGSGVIIFQQVTIGSKGDDSSSRSYPVICSDVKIYAKATIIGNITIGSKAIIGAHSLVTKDVASCELVAGIPAKSLK